MVQSRDHPAYDLAIKINIVISGYKYFNIRSRFDMNLSYPMVNGIIL